VSDVNANSLTTEAFAQGAPPRRLVRPAPGRSGSWLVAGGVPTLLVLAWLVTASGRYTPGSALGYALGLAGGIMMLVLFLYPLRKHMKLLRGLGPIKHWFVVHMVCGVLGPTFILMHSTFHVGSLNAAVALTCMLLVAGSGLVGRYIYTRIHHGLSGERARLRELEAELAMQLQALQPLLQDAPGVAARLKAFLPAALQPRSGIAAPLWAFLTLSIRARWTVLRCVRELRSFSGGPQRRARRTEALVDTYVGSIQRVAHFTTWERLFSWWHVLHVPLVYMLVLSAIAHVVAVHIY
jgi:hypothetical protein